MSSSEDRMTAPITYELGPVSWTNIHQAMTFHLVFHRSMALHLNHLIFLTSYAFGVFFLAAALHPTASTILATTMFVYFWLLHLRSRWYVLLSSCLIAGGVWILALCTVRQGVFGVRRRRLVVSCSGGFIAT
jgi:hypothetical protein